MVMLEVIAFPIKIHRVYVRNVVPNGYFGVFFSSLGHLSEGKRHPLIGDNRIPDQGSSAGRTCQRSKNLEN
jgi:hypothetical protein